MNDLHHIVFILDGNRRWAKEQGLEVFKGHEAGVGLIDSLIDECNALHKSRGLKEISLWVLSTDNLKRSESEVSFLMRIFEKEVTRLLEQTTEEKNIRFFFVGRRELLPVKLQQLMGKLEEKTAGNDGLEINILIAYGGKDELTDAFRTAQKDQKSVDSIAQYFYKPTMRPADLVVRTGKVSRLSGILPYHTMYAEIYTPSLYWPEFSIDELKKAIAWFDNQERRFGK